VGVKGALSGGIGVNEVAGPPELTGAEPGSGLAGGALVGFGDAEALGGTDAFREVEGLGLTEGEGVPGGTARLMDK
jgi:hypothetical protein